MESIKELQKECHQIAKDKGWWNNARSSSECIALMHSELSEALEWMRKDFDAFSDHIAPFTGVEEELADVVIRVMDFAEHHGLALEGALLAKMEYNKNRPYRHGGKKF